MIFPLSSGCVPFVEVTHEGIDVGSVGVDSLKADAFLQQTYYLCHEASIHYPRTMKGSRSLLTLVGTLADLPVKL